MRQSNQLVEHPCSDFLFLNLFEFTVKTELILYKNTLNRKNRKLFLKK